MGTQGRGDLAPIARGAWTGWRHTARYRLIHLDGRRTSTADLVELVLVQGRYTVHVRVSIWLPLRSGDASAVIAEERLDALITALEAPAGRVSQDAS